MLYLSFWPKQLKLMLIKCFILDLIKLNYGFKVLIVQDSMIDQWRYRTAKEKLNGRADDLF